MRTTHAYRKGTLIMGCKGLHCDGCRDGAGGFWLAIIPIAVIIGFAVADGHAIATATADVIKVLITTVIIIGAVAVVSIASVVGVRTALARNRARTALTATETDRRAIAGTVVQPDAHGLSEPGRAAIENRPGWPDGAWLRFSDRTDDHVTR
jgi:hypothetical protein